MCNEIAKGKAINHSHGENEEKWSVSAIEIGLSSREDTQVIKYYSWKEHPQIQAHRFSHEDIEVQGGKVHF